MGPVYFVLAILGCGDSETACQQVRIAPATYTSAAACSAATAEMLVANSDLPYPVVMGQCRASGQAVAGTIEGKPRG